MKIIWIADFTTKEHQGGAQVTNECMVNYGKKIGHEIKYMLPLEFSTDELKKADLIILNNLVRFSSFQIEWIIKNKPYVRYEHDYDAIRRIKNFPNLFKSSKLNIFLSPLHLKETERILDYKIPKVKIIPSPINNKIFKITNKKRPKNTIFMCGNLAPEKGINNIIVYLNFHKNKKLFIAGFSNKGIIDKLIAMKNVSFLGEIKHKDMAEEYNKYESFIHLPEWKEPFGRTVVEAYLCGCHLIVNKNIGALSYKWNWKNYDEIKKKVESKKEFWGLINENNLLRK